MSPLLPLLLLPAVGPPPVGPAELVRQLGSEKYDVRLAAERRLLALGERAMPVVEAGRRHDDAEVRRACGAVLAKLRAMLTARRIQALRAGQAHHTVPLWDHYRRAAGGGLAATRLFAEMYESDPQLFEEVAASLRRGDRATVSRLSSDLARRLRDDFAPRKRPEQGDEQDLPASFAHRLTAALLLGALPGVRLDDEGWAGLVEGPLLCHLRLRAALADKGERGALLRGLLGRWCEAALSDMAMSQALRQATVLELAAPARAVARRALARGKAPMLLAQALKALGKYGEAADIPRLLPWLKREQEYYISHGWLTPELADDALAALVLLTGQQAKDYGTESYSGFSGEHITNAKGKVLLYVPGQALGYFRSQKDRDAAFRKWDDWARTNWARLGLPPPRAEKPAGFDPRRAYAAARDAALAEVVIGRRLRNWGTRGVRAREFIELTIREDRVTVDSPMIAGKFRGQTATWGGRSAGLGAAAIKVHTDEAERTTYQLTAVAHDDAGGTLARTVIDAGPERLTLELERRELRTTLRVRYEQGGRFTLRVTRTRHGDGRVLRDVTHTAADLVALREAAAGDHALLLSLLRQTNAVVPPKRTP